MLKGLLVVIGLFQFSFVYSKSVDTAIFYFRYDLGGSHKVSTADSADYYRVILPPDSGEELYNVKEFYKNGKPKFIGKTDASVVKYGNGAVLLHGTSISFFPDGKKQTITNNYHGYKDGISFEYYPSGKLYCRKKYLHSYNDSEVRYLDCYDLTGTMIAKDGNGHWLSYGFDFKNVLIQGEVKDGRLDGVWKGGTMDADSIKFAYTYKRGDFVSGKSWDKNGKEYSFVNVAEPPEYSGASPFSNYIQRHLPVPKDSLTGKKIKDLIKISFVIETDGHLSHIEIIGNSNIAFAEAANKVLQQCRPWKPRKYYGIPVRSKIIIPLNDNSFWGDYYIEQIRGDDL